MPNPPEFEGKVALVTGAGRGLGRAISVGFAALGAIVAINDITPVNLDGTLQIIHEKGGRARDYVTDISKKMPVQNLVDEVLSDFGRIDFLINHASVSPSVPLLELDEWDWRRTMDVNVTGPFFLIQLVGRVMRDQGGGAIVNVIAERGDQQGTNTSAYSASKQGLAGLTRAAAEELGQYHIRVNGVSASRWQTGGLGKDEGRTFAKLELPDAGQPDEDETVNTILFLCSQTAGNINGMIYDAQGVILDR
jgi:NAD(P)-dependent dehydrogenase (short-subunit alcohol dehydrogenase family)